MELSNAIHSRASIRAYTDAPVTSEQLDALMKAAVRAPNACNMQSWHFYAVADKAVIDGFQDKVLHIGWIKETSLIIVVCLNEDVVSKLTDMFGERGRMYATQDSAAAIENILLTATDLGLGACWMGPMNVEQCKLHLNMPENHTPVALLTIGNPAQNPAPRGRKPLEETFTVIGSLE
jgi:Nitroreductase